jgi:hypothetical protein
MHLVPIIAIIMSFGTVMLAIVTITNFLLKKRLIQSGNISAENIEAISKNLAPMKFDNLKWGLILFFSGVGLIVIDTLPYEKIRNFHLPMGIELICISLGFLIYFFYMKSKKD